MVAPVGLERAWRSRAQLDAWDAEEDAPSSFTDTMGAAFALTRREELSTSAARAWGEKNVERARKIAELGGDEQLAAAYANVPRELLPRLREAELDGDLEGSPYFQALPEPDREAYRHVRDFARRYPGQVADDEALFEEFKTEAAELRSREQFTLERGSGFAAFLGAGGAVFTDPLIWATLPFGAGAGAGRGVGAAVARVGAIEGSIAAATEIPIQAAVYQFKRELEAPWSFADSAINVLAAGVGGAALGGLIGGGIEGSRQMLARYRAAKDAGRVEVTPELDEAETILEDTIALEEQNPLEVETITVDGESVTTRPTNLHQQAMTRAQLQDDMGAPIDVADIVAGVEPEDGLSNVLRRSEDPAELADIDPTELTVDARTFQFKAGTDAAGVTDTLADVTRFDRRLAGVALIWQRADGQRFIADGHQRVALARRALAAGQAPEEVRLNGFVMREADGVTAADARQMAAVKNMAEGTGSALDAAKILREVGPVGEALLPPLPPRSALVRQARGLAQLEEEPFMAVVNGVVEERFGAMIGAATDDSALQQALVGLIARTRPANETQARSIIDQGLTAGVETRTTEDLFGEQQVTESLYLERAQVLDAALREARKDRTVFGRLVSEADRITETGRNRLDTAANQQRIQEAQDAAAQISALANTRGPVSEALGEAARSVKAGARPADAAAAFLETARREILEGHRRGTGARRARPRRDATGRQRPQPALEPTIGRPVRKHELAPDERPAALRALLSRQSEQSLDELYATAERNQASLRAAADDIAAELGEDVELADPGIKARETAAQKLERKSKPPGEVTDVVRLGFMVRTPEIAAAIIERLGRRFEVFDEGVTVTGMGYVDHKALVRFDDGRVGEVQLWEPQIARAKFGRGRELYEDVRTISVEDRAADPALAARVAAAEQASRELYASALANGSPEWRRVAMMALPEDMRARVQALVEAGAGEGSAGAPGNVSRNWARESSSPDSRTSTGETRAQAEPPDATNRPSRPPPGTSRTTAARPSQLKNRSAIDASPRSIVRQVADERTGQPAATKTGTVPDLEYDTVMSRLEELIDNHGELATVATEVEGELIERSARNVVDDLDRLEDTFERIRLCSQPGRTIA